ncbi:SWIM zinc finger family protein [Parafrankia elaeagni]|uniref:SWIM zinc finger family protein n=1 Tax=Parafrankia elaeagni TaxID=222534 RepID=UPI00037AC4C3|nr:SWIM zinc finger family protein [Parafrankia elaeagni]
MSSSTVSTVTRETVLALAPDAAAARAGERLSGVSNWSGLGTSGDAAWGACRGSGATPYRVVVLCGAEAASTCSCPSRKFPCKHALGLLFLVSGSPGALAAGGDPPEWVSGWLGRRAARVDAAHARAAQRAAAGGTAGGSGASGTARSASSVRALARREARVDAGVAELNRWLCDIARDGLGAAQAQPAAWWEGLAARMVDAQAPGLADVVREMARLAARGGADWPDRLTDRLGCLHLLLQGWSRRAQLPPELVDVVRDRVGFSRATADVLAGDRLAGPMDVLGERLFQAGKLQGRRQWLRSSPTGPLAPLVSFGVGRNPPPPGLPVLTRVQAEVAVYPGRRPARLALAGATGAPEPLTELAGLRPPSPGSGPEPGPEGSGSAAATWREVLSAHAATLTADPWADPVAFVVRGITILPAAAGDRHTAPAARAGAGDGRRSSGVESAGWLLRDSAGQALPLAGDAAARWGWWLLAVGGGHPLDLVVEWDSFDITPLSAVPSRAPLGVGPNPPADRPDQPAGSSGGTGRGGPSLRPGARPRSVRPAPGWSELVDVAVVGTARAAVPPLPGLDHLAAEQDGARGADDEPLTAVDRLLRATALAAVARRAGLLPADAGGEPAPSPAPPDHAPVLAPDVSLIVEGALAGQPEARLRCLELTAEHGWHAPAELLCDLLALGRRETEIRVAISRVLGERGRWLAGLHPDGRWARRGTVETWPTADAAERRMLLQELRHDDPAAAVALLRGPADGPPFAPFDQASGAERVAFCEALRIGTGPWDVDLLEHALDDRRTDVREAAVTSALRLPGSRLEERAAARTDGLITVTRHGLPGRRSHRLTFDTPAGVTDEMRRDGVRDPRPNISTAEARAMLLSAELTRVDPAVWAERTGLTAEQFLAADVTVAGVAQEPASWLRRALFPAVVRHRRPEWVLALLPYSEPEEQGRLITCLPEPARAEGLTLALRGHPLTASQPHGDPRSPVAGRARPRQPAEQAALLLASVPGRWSTDFSRAALVPLATLLTSPPGDTWVTSRVLHLLTATAWRIDPEVGLDLARLNPHLIAQAYVDGHAALCSALEARRRLHTALATPPPTGTAAGPARPARPVSPVSLVQEGPR